MADIKIILSLQELNTIVDTMNSYAALHISTNYEAEELAERLEKELNKRRPCKHNTNYDQ